MQRIAQIIGQLTWGGAERQLYELAVRLPAEGFEPVVYCLSEDTQPYREMLEEESIPVRVLPRKSHFDLGRVGTLRKALDQDEIALAHAWLENDDAYTAAAHLFSDRPWMASMRSRPLDRDALRKRIDRWAINRADLVVANQQEVVEYLDHEIGCRGTHVRLVHNGIDLDRLKQNCSREDVRRALRAPHEAPVLLFAGRLEHVKQVDLILATFRMVVEHLPQASLWIAGVGSLADSLRSQAVSLGIERNTHFLGARGDLPDLLHAADLFILCSASEGLPNVVLESMGCGTPALVTRGCGCQELIESGVNGWISPDDQVENLARMIVEILSDDHRLQSVGERAVTTIREGYSVSRMVSQMADLYRELLEQEAVG
jgi:glycosyltransferase involved in cell wall biosynthesis